MTEHRAIRRATALLSAAQAGVLAAALWWSPVPASAQCSLCRDAVAAASTVTRDAMNYAIIGLAMTPYAVVALAAWFLSPTLRAFVRLRLRRGVATNAGGPA